MNANDKQVGGDHYSREGEQHWDRQWKLNGRGYFVGCITKYVERYHLKNGIQDLEKAKHFLEKLIELEKGGHPEEGTPFRAELKFDHETRNIEGVIPAAEEPGRGYIHQD